MHVLKFQSLTLPFGLIRKKYVVCAIIRNALTCMYGNQTSALFALEPLSVRQYFLDHVYFVHQSTDMSVDISTNARLICRGHVD